MNFERPKTEISTMIALREKKVDIGNRTSSSIKEVINSAVNYFDKLKETPEGKINEKAIENLAKKLNIEPAKLEEHFFTGFEYTIKAACQSGILDISSSADDIKKIISGYVLYFRSTLNEFKRFDTQKGISVALKTAERGYLLPPHIFRTLKKKYSENPLVNDLMLKVVIISHPKDPEAAVERFLNEVVDVENRYNNKLLPDIIRNILLTQPKGYVAFIEKALQEIGRLEKIYGKDVELTHNEITRMYMRDRENSEITIGKFLEEMETLKQLYKDNKLVTPSMIKRCILIYPDHEKGRQYLKNMIASIENLMATYGKDGDITLAVIRETVLAYKNPEAEIRKILKLFS